MPPLTTQNSWVSIYAMQIYLDAWAGMLDILEILPMFKERFSAYVGSIEAADPTRRRLGMEKLTQT